jgi:Ran GTPase-activating protein (RanGAP) involved in mRNA processing and transport
MTIDQVIKVIRKNKSTVEVIDLSNNILDVESAVRILMCVLNEAPRVRYVDLSSNRIPDGDGLPELEEVIVQLCKRRGMELRITANAFATEAWCAKMLVKYGWEVMDVIDRKFVRSMRCASRVLGGMDPGNRAGLLKMMGLVGDVRPE